MKRKSDPPPFYMDYIKRQKPQQWDDIAPVRKDLLTPWGSNNTDR